MDARVDFLRGATELLILRCVAGGPRHGSDIAAQLTELFEGVPSARVGSLYGRLRRMERLGWLASSYGVTETNRMARYYRITPAGWKQLETSAGEWSTFSGLLSGFLLAP